MATELSSDREVVDATGEHGGVQPLAQGVVDGGGTRVLGIGQDDGRGHRGAYQVSVTLNTHRDRVLLVLARVAHQSDRARVGGDLRDQPTTAHRAVRDLMATVSDLFIPGQFSNHDTLTLDGTLIPVHDQSITNPSKNYRRSVNVHVLATLDHQIVHVSQA